MKKVVLSALMFFGIACAPIVPAPICPGGELNCGNYCCPDDIHYACGQNGQCVLISCDTGFQLCGNGCIPVTADCCNQVLGLYCQTGEVCCGINSCIPIGSSCCGVNGSFCPVGRVCCYGGTECC